ncbi:MAG: hypothetical protein EAZ37_03195 [Burkholderiales bacterium]|nr:MAG: hypothetical protein EAZ37_03195 [Burkholderiales bacterium]
MIRATNVRRIWKYTLALSLLTLFLVFGLIFWDQRGSNQSLFSASERVEPLKVLHARCVQDMLSNTCKVMGSAANQVSAQPGELVFIAGVGTVDAVEYAALHAAGEAMCSVVTNACINNWEGAQCRTGRRLYLAD